MEEVSIEDVLHSTEGELVAGSETVRFQGVSTDSRTARAGDLFFAIRGPHFDGHHFLAGAAEAGARGAVVSHLSEENRRSWPSGEFAVVRVEDTVRALGDLAAEYRRRFSPLTVAVTGTNGKTTAKEMIAAVLSSGYRTCKSQGNFNNLIGVPLSLFHLSSGHTALVVELGMSALGEIARLAAMSLPRIGVVTNIGPAHLATLGSIEEVAKAKAELFESLPDDGIALVNADDPRVVSIGESWGGKTITYGTREGAEVRAEGITFVPGRTRFRLAGGTAVELSLLGKGGVYGALAALAVAKELDLPLDEAVTAVASVPPTPMRMEWIDLGGVSLINDAYNANPASVTAAIEVLAQMPAGRRIAVLGDMLELGEETGRWHRSVGEAVVRGQCDMLIAVGEASSHLVDGAHAAGMDEARTFWSSGVEGAGDLLCELLREGDLVLVKGSRAMGMERLVDQVRAAFRSGTTKSDCRAFAGER